MTLADKVIVSISGGVDSSVAALLLRDQGYRVEAIFMKNWNERQEDGACRWEADVEDAVQVCETLKIPLNTVDLSSEYWEGVFAKFIDAYRTGLTPNPDVLCNQEIKFKAFVTHSQKLGASKVATGHYARIEAGDDEPRLLKGTDANKDQSYFLCRLTRRQLARTLFPVGSMKKPVVRKLAEQAGLGTFLKKDSTGICFVGERHFRNFLGRFIPAQPGEIRSLDDGNLLGCHDGVHFYTIGQRHGLGIGGVKGTDQSPWYVAAKDIGSNTLLVVQGHNHPALFRATVTANDMHWIGEPPASLPFSCSAKIRYRQDDQPCLITDLDNDKTKVVFERPQRAVTPGQYLVFYQNDVCLGGGIIY